MELIIYNNLATFSKRLALNFLKIFIYKQQ